LRVCNSTLHYTIHVR